MTQQDLTPLQVELNMMTPGEIREHAALPHSGNFESRFFRIDTTGEALLASTPFWKNEPRPELIPSQTPRPVLPHLPELPPVSLSASEPPVIVFDGDSTEFGHLYRQSWATLITELLLGCILELDVEAVEYAPATIVDSGGAVRTDLPRCFFILPRRAIDCIDTQRTSVRLSFLAPLPGITNPMRVCEFDGYTVRADMPASVHVFSNVFNGDLLFSIDLIERARTRGVWGVWARRTESGMAEKSFSL